ncbi:MAG: SCO1664 family protein [Actinobacteria bacterium]|nr:SCO1664 family protein [Actinomycetota bacterium]
MISHDDLRDVLTRGDLDIEGRLGGASNATLRGTATLSGVDAVCVYKPRRGERPLWDFASGSLGLREVAAHRISEALGWGLVPMTVWRDSGPFGPGMCQSWIEADDERAPVRVVEREPAAGWMTVAEGEGYEGSLVRLVHEDSADLRRLSLLDVVLNNADRKGGHALRDADGRLYGIDHGLTFHEEDKIRTVLWGWAGHGIDPEDIGHLRALSDRWAELVEDLEEFLSLGEIRATQRRVGDLLDLQCFPEPVGAWPALPWPAM